MLVYVEQDIFQSPAQVLVNTVNTVGVMGKGIAKRFKTVYPQMYIDYRKYCENGSLDIGKLWLYKSENKWVLNFPTKKHWRNPSKIEYIEKGLQKFVDTYQDKGITSISFPQLGCGNGGLDWEEQVKPLMEKYLKNLPINVFVHLYSNKNNSMEHMNTKETLDWLHRSPGSLSIKQVWDELIQEIEDGDGVLDNNSIWKCSVIDIDDTSFTLENKYIYLEREGYHLTITYENLFDMWITLRDYGYLLSYDLPIEYSNNDEDIDAIFMLLNELSFIKYVTVLTSKGNEILGVMINNRNLPDVDDMEVSLFG